MLTVAVDRVLNQAVQSGALPHVVAVAADRDEVVYEGAAGPRAVGYPEPLTADTPLRISSLTATVTMVAALQQIERGHLELDAPVDIYCPEFAQLPVLEGFDGDTPKLRPAGVRTTVRQLATHTSGLGYWFLDPRLRQWESVTGTPNVLSGSAAALTAPLSCDPGTRFAFGIGADWLGKVVEAVSGLCLDAYLDAHILGPLGMHHTGFTSTSPEQLAPVHVRGPGGRWTPTAIEWNQRPDWWSGGHGLYSTARDFLAFQRMLLGGGALGDAQVLAPDTVAGMFVDQLGGGTRVPAVLRSVDPAVSGVCIPGRSVGWGLGMLVESADRAEGRRAGSGGWSGVFNTHFWVDPASGVTGAVYSQALPMLGASAARLYRDFERCLYAWL